MSVMRAMKARLRNRGVQRGLVIVVALVLVFEVTVHFLPPDGVTVTTINYNSFTPSGIAGLNIVTTSRTTLARDAQTRAAIDRLNNGFNTAPIGTPINYAFGGGCMTLSGYTEYQVTFTWHGLPLRVWTTNTGCPDFTENSGGISNPLWVSILENDGQPALHALQ